MRVAKRFNHKLLAIFDGEHILALIKASINTKVTMSFPSGGNA